MLASFACGINLHDPVTVRGETPLWDVRDIDSKGPIFTIVENAVLCRRCGVPTDPAFRRVVVR